MSIIISFFNTTPEIPSTTAENPQNLGAIFSKVLKFLQNSLKLLYGRMLEFKDPNHEISIDNQR